MASLAQDDEKPEDIVDRLMPKGVPTELALPRGAAVKKTVAELQAARKQAEGKRAQQIAFLLATLKSDYEVNRDFLMQALEGCNSVPAEDCYPDTAAFVIALYDGGDTSVLRPLLKVGSKAGGRLGTTLGNFYADMLTQQPQPFVDGIASLPPEAQRNLCALAASTSSGGMTAEERSQVRSRLQEIGTQAAARCVGAIVQAGLNDR